MTTTKQRIPKLRFPEFSGEWEEKKLGETLSIGSGKDHKSLADGDVPVYGSGGLMRYVNQYLYDGESVCIGRKGTIDKPIYLEGKFWTVDTLFYTHTFVKANPQFIYSVFQRINWEKYNEASGVPSLSKKTIECIKSTIPTLPEQQKIASFLSAVDSKIESLTKKKTLLEQYKKGMMQKLFSQEIRFKDDQGNEFPDWEEKRLGDLAKFINGRAYKQTELLNKGKYPVLRVGNFFSNNKWYYSDLELDEDKYCDNGDLLYAWSASFGPKIWSGTRSIFHYHIWKVSVTKNVNQSFLFHVLDNETMTLKNRSSNGFALLHITKGVIENWKIKLPSQPEQKKIADFLLFIDLKIDLAGKEVKKVQNFKKGLLQQMFV